jgi:hypothetical protein
MSQHETLLRLRHMLDYACEAIAMAAGHTRADLPLLPNPNGLEKNLMAS